MGLLGFTPYLFRKVFLCSSKFWSTALVRMSCLVIDAALKDAKDAGPQTVALDEAATLGELRRLIRRLPGLPSCAGRFHVCHDGSLLQAHAAHAPPRLTLTLTS